MSNTLKKLHNLALNCQTKNEISKYLVYIESGIETEPAKKPFTVLGPYYFEPSKNDPENKLKRLFTRTEY